MQRIISPADDSFVHNLASYIPTLLVDHFAKTQSAFNEPMEKPIEAAVFFADISGFTQLTESLSQQGSSGAETLTRILNGYFGKIINIMTQHGGDVLKFAGDAMLAAWPIGLSDDSLPRVCLRATQCALTIQQEMRSFVLSQDVKLSLTISIGVGPLNMMLSGGVLNRFEFSLTGQPLEQVSQAEHYASPGQVILSPEAKAMLGDQVSGEYLEKEHFCLASVNLPLALKSIEPIAVNDAMVKAFGSYIPGAILNRLRSGVGDWLGEMRKVSVIFLNLPSLTRTTPLSETQAITSTLQTILYRFEGSVNKLSIDDKGTTLVAVFGLPPFSHEDDALRAVRAGQAMQQALHELTLTTHIGITTGKVYCGIVGNLIRREYTVMGNTVNLAARLMQKANGSVRCDQATYQFSQQFIHFTEHKPEAFKGIAKPLVTYQPNEDQSVQITSDTHATELVGRDKPRQVLNEALNEINQVIKKTLIIEGEPGIGKSHFLQHARLLTHRHGIPVLDIKADAIEKNTPYFAFRVFFNQLFPMHHDQTQCIDTIQTHLPSAQQPWLPVLSSILPINIADNQHTRVLIAQERASKAYELVYDLLKSLYKDDKVLVLMIEDLHYLDSASWQLLDYLHSGIDALSIIATARPEAPGLSYSTDFNAFLHKWPCLSLVLDRLSFDEIGQLLCNRFDIGELPPSVHETVFQFSKGHPLFSEQFFLSLNENGYIKRKGPLCIIKKSLDLNTVELPHTIEGLMTSRLDKLETADLFVLKLASIVGSSFDLSILQDIHPFAPRNDALHQSLVRLNQLDMIVFDSATQEYQFKSPLILRVVYELMLLEQRKLLHHTAAVWYEFRYQGELLICAPIIAYHYQQAGLLKKALDYYKQGAEYALQQGSNHDAISHLNTCFDLLKQCDPGPFRDQYETQLYQCMGPALLDVI